MKNKRFISLTLLAVMLVALLSGCGGSKGAADIEGYGELSDVKGEITYPVKSDKELLWWLPANANVTANSPSLNETVFAEELQKRTGIKVKFVHPTLGQESENFSLLMASGNKYDIISWSWYSYSGSGPAKAINEGQIIPLNDAIANYAPNFSKFLAENPELDSLVKSDSGDYYAFPCLKPDAASRVFVGPMIRKDWLDELGLEIPETIDEWETVLKAFKEKKGATAPLGLSSLDVLLKYKAFMGAFNVDYNYYVDNRKVVYGPTDRPEQFKAFLTLMNKWYNEGLLDKNVATSDSKIFDANFLNDKIGATVGFAGSGMGKYIAAKKDDPKFNLVATKYPVMKKGEVAEFGQLDNAYHTGNSAAAINSKSENKALAIRLLDYLYSEEGSRLASWGVEGVTYTMENGEPKYTELVLNNPDGLPTSQALAQYAFTYEAPYVVDVNAHMQKQVYQNQRDALELWKQTNQEAHTLPPITKTDEEGEEFKALDGEIYTYVNEMISKFIVGIEPLSEYDSFAAELERRGASRCVEILQAGLDRYNARKSK